MSEFKCPACGTTLTVDVKGTQRAVSMEDIKRLFPEDLESLLSFQEMADHFLVKPRQFLGPDVFSQVAARVREVGGEYISAGKESHFRIPK